MTKLFVNLFVFLAICALANASSSGRHRKKQCTDSDHPVCATDGTKNTLFKNECHLRAENSKRHKDHTPKLEKIEISQCFERCDQVCTDEYAPLCGVSTKGEGQKRFQNRCEFDLENCQSGNIWKVFHEGECPEPPVDDDCPEHCSLEVNPICGTLGDVDQTFQNLCFLKTDICISGREWKIKNDGECIETGPECDETCPQIYSPICAKYNGESKTFSNECFLDYEICTTKNHWDVLYKGECQKPTEECSKPCPKIYEPICASNDHNLRTFSNQCLLDVEICSSKQEWHIQYNGECQTPMPTPPPKPTTCPDACPAIYQPVCAIYRGYKRTFSNACEMSVESCNTKRDWEKMYDGECTPVPTQPPVTGKPTPPNEKCPDVCPTVYEPVCGFSDGTMKTFSNACQLEVECCKTGIDWQVHFDGPCDDEYQVQVKNSAVSICPTIFEPICATCNGENRTFTNKCQMNAENNRTGSEWEIIAHGECEKPQPPVDPSRACPRCSDHYHPICATYNGTEQTFKNECFMITANCDSNATWEIVSLHECDNPPKPCPMCSDYNHPMCGSYEGQQKTFTNECHMISENCNLNTNWELKNDGECIEPNPECDEYCPEIYSPICASLHGVNQTFTNECILEYEICISKNHWKMLHKGECKEPVKECNKVCSKIYKPVCAKHKGEVRTFTNECLLEVESCVTDEDWDIKYDGECKVPVKECNMLCPEIYQPVCASNDGKRRTFTNKCFVEVEACATKTEWNIDYDGMCKEPSVPCNKICPYIYRPICAELNGVNKTFSNECLAKVEACEANASWKVIHDGECEMRNSTVPTPVHHGTTTPTPTTTPIVYPITTQMPTTTSMVSPITNQMPTTTPVVSPITTETPTTTPAITPPNENCPDICSDIDEPVCASSNGSEKTFPNACELSAECCRTGENWQKIHEGECKPPTTTVPPHTTTTPTPTPGPSNCPDVCSDIYEPMCCSFNGTMQTFSNACELKAKCCKTGEDWQVLFDGPCDDEYKVQVKNAAVSICPTNFDPICAMCKEEKRTFSNKCQFDAYVSKAKEACKILGPGECETQTTTVGPTVFCPKCTDHYDPVCGFFEGEQMTFINECQLFGANCNSGKDWVKIYKGECKASHEPRTCPNICPISYVPVCATYNGVKRTFPNECELNHEAYRTGKTWVFLSMGECDYCPSCSDDSDPVCAEYNGEMKTFDNNCKMEYENCNTGSKWMITSRSLCENPNCPKFCQKIYSPICASNNDVTRTFGNICEMRVEACNTKQNWSVLSDGECPDPNCPESCTMEFNPVCATSEGTSKTFVNECLLKSEICKTEINWKIVHLGSCSSQTELIPVGPDQEVNPDEISNSELLKIILQYIRSHITKSDSDSEEEEERIPEKITEG